MTAGQDRNMGTGRVPGLNTERIYTTTIPADELAQALADHFRAQGFEAQVFRTSGDRTAMQARKESLWRNLLGVAYALTVTFTPGESQLTIGLGATSGSMRRSAGRSGWWRSRRCCWAPPTASGRRTSWTRRSGR